MGDIFGNTLEAALIVALIVANGFFVATEFALVKVRASQLRPMEKKGGWRVRLALRASKHLGAMLSASQLGVTLASLGLGWLGEPFLAHQLEPWLGRWGITDPHTVSSISFVIAFSVITFVHIIFGELGPKAIAIQRAPQISLWFAGPLIAFYYIFFPFIWLLNVSANRLLGLIGLRPAGEGEHAISSEELEYVFS